jgi:hypothetical protein
MIDCNDNCGCGIPLERLPEQPYFGSASDMLNAAEIQELTSEISLDNGVSTSTTSKNASSPYVR